MLSLKEGTSIHNQREGRWFGYSQSISLSFLLLPLRFSQSFLSLINWLFIFSKTREEKKKKKKAIGSIMMDLDSIECVSTTDGLEEDEIHHHSNTHHHNHNHNLHRNAHHPNNLHQFSSSKPSAPGFMATAPATSVHELLECPVCTNSMYPPIHQVLPIFRSFFSQLATGVFLIACLWSVDNFLVCLYRWIPWLNCYLVLRNVGRYYFRYLLDSFDVQCYLLFRLNVGVEFVFLEQIRNYSQLQNWSHWLFWPIF